MTTFETIAFDPVRCLTELDALAQLLQDRPSLTERQDLLPFFRTHRHLAASLGAYHPNLVTYNRLAYELDLFGAFTADVVVGDWERHAFLFVEFEDARPRGIFTRGGRATSRWSPRFSEGFGQIVDWSWKLDDLQRTESMASVFGAGRIDAAAILVIGREQGLDATERARLAWWREHVLVDSKHVFCCTFDELLRDLRDRLQAFRRALATE